MYPRKKIIIFSRKRFNLVFHYPTITKLTVPPEWDSHTLFYIPIHCNIPTHTHTHTHRHTHIQTHVRRIHARVLVCMYVYECVFMIYVIYHYRTGTMMIKFMDKYLKSEFSLALKLSPNTFMCENFKKCVRLI